jgi:hypothetical protein
VLGDDKRDAIENNLKPLAQGRTFRRANDSAGTVAQALALLQYQPIARFARAWIYTQN